MDFSGVEFLDSTGVGWLINWHKQLRQHGRLLILVAPAPAVTRALKFMRVQDFFISAPDVAAAQKIRESRNHQDQPQTLEPESAPGTGALVWRGEITAANAERLWELARAALATLGEGFVIDLSAVPYIDSSGLGLLVRAKKLAQSQGHALKLIGLQPAVRNVLHLSRLEKFLLE
jgi:anti-anti-sigma factor